LALSSTGPGSVVEVAVVVVVEVVEVVVVAGRSWWSRWSRWWWAVRSSPVRSWRSSS
jgi:hypothetical protein